ncbi:hypothetical protein ACQ4M4_14390 [Leptolyngbya sp. AN02str]|uniref:hypothetical protein n=1 Tax=Leptolyngbya sp. AN02str TaxID=3423363 RepID=UPI003D30FD23
MLTLLDVALWQSVNENQQVFISTDRPIPLKRGLFLFHSFIKAGIKGLTIDINLSKTK